MLRGTRKEERQLLSLKRTIIAVVHERPLLVRREVCSILLMSLPFLTGELRKVPGENDVEFLVLGSISGYTDTKRAG